MNNDSLNERIFTVSDGKAYWSYPDGSNRCFTQEDAALINNALKPVLKADGYKSSPTEQPVGMPFSWNVIAEWCGGIDNIEAGKTYNVTGTHLHALLRSYQSMWESANKRVSSGD